MKETDTIKNAVHLEGAVCSCVITHTPGKDTVIAQMEICTASIQKNAGTAKLKNPVIHRAVAVASGENAARLRALSNETGGIRINLSEDLPKLKCVSVDGRLTKNDKAQPYVAVAEEGLAFPERLAFKNTAILQGRVLETTYNDAYAGAVLQCEGEGGRQILVPVNIYSKDNPRKYADLASGKIRKGDILSVKGPLISGFYSNGEKEVYRCHVNINNYDNLSRKRTQQKTSSLGV